MQESIPGAGGGPFSGHNRTWSGPEWVVQMKRPTVASPRWLCTAALAVVLCLSCTAPEPGSPTATPDYVALETQVAAKLGATLTAKAPPTQTFTPEPTRVSPTPTSSPRPGPSPTSTPEPRPSSARPLLAYARIAQGGAANIVLSDVAREEEQVLTHFVEPLNMCSLAWSRDGEWLIFVSGHDYMHSRSNERNVFVMRPDGSDLRMVTGEYVAPEMAPGPYSALRGRVIGGNGPCLVSAQGAASIVVTGEDGAFELPGVPLSAKWARAVCPNGESALQGDVGLVSLDNNLMPVSITVEAKGQGWLQASLSRDGHVVAGTYYQWTRDPEGEREYRVEGVLYSVEGARIGQLELPPDTRLLGVAWSPGTDQLLGALTGEKSAWLWIWDARGSSLGEFMEIPSPDEEIVGVSNPCWSPDGSQLAFSLRRWLWWEEDKHKTDLMLVSAKGDGLRTLVDSEWGAAANHATWAGDGRRIYYHLSQDLSHDAYCSDTGGDIWVVTLSEEPVSVRWTEDGVSYLPAASP